jgi:hypothetical protein
MLLKYKKSYFEHLMFHSRMLYAKIAIPFRHKNSLMFKTDELFRHNSNIRAAKGYICLRDYPYQ